MKSVNVFCLVLFVFCSCSEPVPENRMYTEKDIEGYWATNNAIKGTLWMDSLVPEPITDNFLRLYNSTFGFSDTTYKVLHDTILIVEHDYFNGETEFVPRYKIVGAAEDRLILIEIKTGLEIIYYSLLTVPATNEKPDTIFCYPGQGGLGMMLTRDSLTYYPVEFADPQNIPCTEYQAHYNVAVDTTTLCRIQAMYSRIKSEDVLFARDPSNTITPMSFTLEMHGDRGLEIVGSAAYVTSPLIRAIYWELAALSSHLARE